VPVSGGLDLEDRDGHLALGRSGSIRIRPNFAFPMEDGIRKLN